MKKTINNKTYENNIYENNTSIVSEKSEKFLLEKILNYYNEEHNKPDMGRAAEAVLPRLVEILVKNNLVDQKNKKYTHDRIIGLSEDRLKIMIKEAIGRAARRNINIDIINPSDACSNLLGHLRKEAKISRDEGRY